MEESIQGLNDLPFDWKNDRDNTLGVNPYLQALKDFILQCPTPFSIAIQGDWGTGKTSVINYLNQQLTKESVKTVSFNTWQYSQFNMSESLYFSFLTTLSKAIDPQGDGFKSFIKQLAGLSLSLGKEALSSFTFLDKSHIDEMAKSLFEQQDQQIDKISKLHEEFAHLVKTKLNKKFKRLVIFIDDLDRLEPSVAVGLLEVIKLFTDVELCVFVLAIDYDVVVQGVRQKYGQEMSLSKCRSFFDKIIQLPFRMPVEQYNLQLFAERYFSKIIDPSYFECLIPFIETTVGKNPRSLKRMFNAYELLLYVYKMKGEEMEPQDRAALFCCLCIQNSSEEAYSLLLQDSSWDPSNSLNLISLKDDAPYVEDSVLEDALHTLYPQNSLGADIIVKVKSILCDLPSTVEKLYGDKKKGMTALRKLLRTSSITAVGDTANLQRKAPTKIDTVVFDGEPLPVSNATSALVETYLHYLKDAALSDKELRSLKALAVPGSQELGIFRYHEDIMVGGTTMWLGKSSSFETKRNQVDQLCKVLKLAPGRIQWYYNDHLIYEYTGD